MKPPWKSIFSGWFLCFASCGLLGCEDVGETDRVAVNPERVQDGGTILGELVPDADKQHMLGAKDALAGKLSAALMDAIGTGGPGAAIRVCRTQAPEIAEVVATEYGLRIGRTGVRLRNESNVAPTWAQELIAAKTETPRFVVLDNGTSGALLPIKLQSQCLLCHGPMDQLLPEVRSQLAKLYPNDNATGFVEGELRGWFWIEKSDG